MKELALTVQSCERNEKHKLLAKTLTAERVFSGPDVIRRVFSPLIGITPNDDQIMMSHD